MDNRLLLLYFVIGGAVVAATTYFGSQGKGFIAALISLMPAVTIITLVTIYLHGGVDSSLSYLKNMLFVAPIWLAYIGLTLLLLPRIGLAPTLIISVGFYFVGVFVLQRLLDH